MYIDKQRACLNVLIYSRHLVGNVPWDDTFFETIWATQQPMLVLKSLGGTAAPSKLSARSSLINLYSDFSLPVMMIPRCYAFSIDLNRYAQNAHGLPMVML